jgi:hypothetical protein
MLSVEYLIFINPQLLDSIFWVWVALYGNFNLEINFESSFLSTNT